MNTPINFELAKLLKEKGFDENHEYMVFTSVETEKYPEGELVLKPTIAEVMMWLYEKYDIWIIPSYELNIENHKREWFWIAIQGGEEVAYQYKDFNSPTEAYEAAIEFTLENLI
jgi:hypothetical protein